MNTFRGMIIKQKNTRAVLRKVQIKETISVLVQVQMKAARCELNVMMPHTHMIVSHGLNMIIHVFGKVPAGILPSAT